MMMKKLVVKRACKRRLRRSPEQSVVGTESDWVHPASQDTVGSRSVQTELADGGDVCRHTTQLRKIKLQHCRSKAGKDRRDFE